MHLLTHPQNPHTPAWIVSASDLWQVRVSDWQCWLQLTANDTSYQNLSYFKSLINRLTLQDPFSPSNFFHTSGVPLGCRYPCYKPLAYSKIYCTWTNKLRCLWSDDVKLTAADRAWLTAANRAWLTAADCAWLTAADRAWLTAADRAWLTAADHAWLTAADRASLTAADRAWPITNNDSVLCTLEDCASVQSLWNTTTALTRQFWL